MALRKHRVVVELDVWAADAPAAAEEAEKRLRQVADIVAAVPRHAFEGPLPRGSMQGEPFTDGRPGWRCLFSIDEAKD